MNGIRLPYGRTELYLDPDTLPVKAVLTPACLSRAKKKTVREALEAPVGSKRLCELCENRQKLLIITSDHTRPLPSRETLPLLLAEARRHNPRLEIRILVATGCHRGMTDAEMEEKFGADLVARETILNHDSGQESAMAAKGILPSGGPLFLNKLVDWADLVISEGFIEPHFFAGFSGGRKSILPGIASRETVHANHCAEFIASPYARTGNLENNPIHEDMIYAAKKAGLGFILNVVLDHDKKIIAAFAGDPELAHMEGCAFVEDSFRVRPVRSKLVITTNGGYPLDQNIYQSVKGLTAAEQCVEEGGVIIMAAECVDGHGGDTFYQWFTEGLSPEALLKKILAAPRTETKADQWQAQILARVLCKCIVFMVTSEKNRPIVEQMNMRYAGSLEEAAARAKEIVGSDAACVVIPDGVGIIVE